MEGSRGADGIYLFDAANDVWTTGPDPLPSCGVGMRFVFLKYRIICMVFAAVRND